MNGKPFQRLDRRLDEHQRQRAFTLAAAVLLAATIALTWASRPDAGPVPAATTSTASTTPAAVPSPPPASTPRVRSRPDGQLRRTARRFLAGYLPYLYGTAPLRRVEGASRTLRRRLGRERLRVPPAARRRSPRVRSLHVGPRVRDARAWLVTARVADGDVAVYPIELLIGRRHGRLVVIETGGE